MREATSRGTLGASPQPSEPKRKSQMASLNTRQVPKRSATQPLTGMKTARLSV